MIHVEELRREYVAERKLLGVGPRRGPARVALAGIDLDVAVGEIVGIAGLNGSGKSSLLRILAGLLTPSAGRVRVGDVDPGIDRVGVARLAALVVGEERSFYWRLSGRHNLEFAGALYGCRPAEASARSDAALRRVGLSGAADRRVQVYSSGMRQRLAFARALVREPRVLLLDELTRALDDEGIDRLWGIVGECAGAGVAVLATATRRADLEGFCDRLLALDGGLLAPAEATRAPEVSTR